MSIKRYSREDINSMKKQFLLQDRRFIDISSHKAVVETLVDELKSNKQQYIDDERTITRLQNKIEELEKQIIEKDRLLFENEYGLEQQRGLNRC